MSRVMSPEVLEAIRSQYVRTSLLMQGTFINQNGEEEILRLWTGIGTLQYDGATYYGAGNLIGVGAIGEKAGPQPSGIELTLSAVSNEFIAIALGYEYQGQPLHCWLAMFDDSFNIIGAAIPLFSGNLDVMAIEKGSESATISVTAENRLIDLTRASNLRWTDAAQKDLYENDRGFEFVESLQDREVVWGR